MGINNIYYKLCKKNIIKTLQMNNIIILTRIIKHQEKIVITVILIQLKICQ